MKLICPVRSSPMGLNTAEVLNIVPNGSQLGVAKELHRWYLNYGLSETCPCQPTKSKCENIKIKNTIQCGNFTYQYHSMKISSGIANKKH